MVARIIEKFHTHFRAARAEKAQTRKQSVSLRPLLFPAVFLGIGTVLGPEFNLGFVFQLLISLASFTGCILLGSRAGSHLLLLLACLFLGSARATFELPANAPSEEKGIIEGDIEEVTPFGLKVRVCQIGETPTRFRAALYGIPTVPVFKGQQFKVETKLRQIAGASNPGEYDSSWLNIRKGQVVSGSFKPHSFVLLSEPSGIQQYMSALQISLQKQVESLAPSLGAASFFLTLAAGQRANLGESLEDDFAKSGLAHVLSVSGLHVAVLALALFKTLRFLFTRRMRSIFRAYDARQIAAPLCIPPIFLYVVFTGNQGPAVRSAVMCAIVLLGHSLQRKSDVINSLALSFIVMTLIQPWTPLDLSCALSFLSVCGLLFLASRVRQFIPFKPTKSKGHQILEAILQSLLASLCATVFTAPLILTAFQRFSVAGFVTNVLTLPLSGIVTLLAASSAALHAISPTMATPFIWAGCWVSELFVQIATKFASFSWSSLVVASPSAWTILMWCLGLWLVSFFTGRKALTGLLCLGIAVATSIHKERPVNGLKITFLSVGHGDAIVLSSNGHHALIDGGGVPDGADIGQKIVIPYLRSVGISQLDFAALSHPHPDHALGLISALEQIKTKRLLMPEDVGDGALANELMESSPEAKIEFLQMGSPSFQLGQATVEVLGPPVNRELFQGENDGSMILKVTHGENSFLFTGDIEGLGELALQSGPVTVLKAPHHGSDTSSSEMFVRMLRPKHVVYSVGKNNRYNFPRPIVVNRYDSVGAKGYRTDDLGAVTFFSDGKSLNVDSFLKPGQWKPRRFRFEFNSF
jgi:competence protein ComEC